MLLLFLNAVATVSYELAREPVCDDIASLAFWELPGATITIGFLDICARLTNSFPSVNCSM